MSTPTPRRRCFAAWAPSRVGPSRELPLAMGLDVTELRSCGRPPRRRCESGGRALWAPRLAREPSHPGPWLPTRSSALSSTRCASTSSSTSATTGFTARIIHDPFAVAAAIDRSLVFTQPVFVDVETGPGLAHAMTVADWRGITHQPAERRGRGRRQRRRPSSSASSTVSAGSPRHTPAWHARRSRRRAGVAAAAKEARDFPDLDQDPVRRRGARRDRLHRAERIDVRHDAGRR